MPRQGGLAGLALLALAGCGGDFRLVNAELTAAAGTRVVAQIEVSGCRSATLPELRGERGTSLPPGISSAGTDGCLRYCIADPGAPTCEPTRVAPGCKNDHRYLTIDVATDAEPGRHALRVQLSGCGGLALLPLSLEVTGPVDLGGFCGASTADVCVTDDDCAGPGPICSSWRSPGSFTWLAGGGACADPVASGVECGCVRKVCAWRMPAPP